MVPEDILTNDIIQITLLKDKGENAKLISWNHENCTSAKNNYFNVVKRITVQYVQDEKESEVSYVAKLNPCKPDDSFNPYRQRAMLKEIFFYNNLLPVLNSELEKRNEAKLRVPKYLHSSVDAEREVIMFEDLKLRGFETLPRTEKMDEAHTELMVKEISRLHAASFFLQKNLGKQNLEEAYPLLIETWMVGDLELREAFEIVFQKGVKLNLNLMKTIENFKELIPWIQDLRNKEMETLLKELQSTSPWRTICHGDYHRTNVLFRYNESKVPEEVMMLDWQTIRVANPASEIDYLLHSSYSGPSRDQYFPVITKIYFKTYHRIVGSETFFTLECFETQVKRNHFGLLLCFFLVPLSLCVSDTSELFKIDKTNDEISEEEALKSAKEMQKANPALSFVVGDYLREIFATNLWK